MAKDHKVLQMCLENIAKPFLGNEKLTALLVTVALGGIGYTGYDIINQEHVVPTISKPPEIAPVPVPVPVARTSVIEAITCPKVVCGCDAAIKKRTNDHKKEHDAEKEVHREEHG